MDGRFQGPDGYNYEQEIIEERDPRSGDRWGQRWGEPRGGRGLPPDSAYPPHSNQRGQPSKRRFSPLYVDPRDMSIVWPIRPLLSNRSHGALETFFKLAGAWDIKRDPSSRTRADVVAEALRPVFGHRLPQMEFGPGPIQLDSSLGIILLLLFLIDQRLPSLRR